jgi:hypothetical protein
MPAQIHQDLLIASAAVAILVSIGVGAWAGLQVQAHFFSNSRHRHVKVDHRLPRRKAQDALPAPQLEEPPLVSDKALSEESEGEIVDVRATTSWHEQHAAPLLVQQTVRPIPMGTSHATWVRPLPAAHGANVSAAYLAWEYEAITAFLHKQLKADPRLRPSMVEVTTDHLRRCLSCDNEKLHRLSLQQTLAPAEDGALSDERLAQADAPLVDIGLTNQPLVCALRVPRLVFPRALSTQTAHTTL